MAGGKASEADKASTDHESSKTNMYCYWSDFNVENIHTNTDWSSALVTHAYSHS